MAGWRRHEGRAVALDLANIDTDQLIPARFMKEPREAGYGGFLLHDHRFDADEKPRVDFPLNAPQAEGASILVARRNFGGGSSREAAVYALIDFGIRCVAAPSFGDIFAGNAVNNGLLPARLSEADCERLLATLAAGPQTLTVDLEAATLTGAGLDIAFELDPVGRRKLIEGWDDIDLTARYESEITRFAAGDRERRPWAQPRSRPVFATMATEKGG